MKTCLTLFTIFFSLAAWGQEQQPNCGNDYNCYYRELAQEKEQKEQQEDAAQDAYRSDQIELQERQLEEVQEQNQMIDKQLELQEEENQALMPEESVTEPL